MVEYCVHMKLHRKSKKYIFFIIHSCLYYSIPEQKQQQIPTKDWQDGLRALLPNVNVSFGALPHGATNGTDQGRMFSQQPGLSLNEHHHHERMQRQQHQSRTGT